MSKEKNPNPIDEKAIIRKNFLERTASLPLLARTKARLGFVLAPVLDKITVHINSLRTPKSLGGKEAIKEYNEKTSNRSFNTRTGRR